MGLGEKSRWGRSFSRQNNGAVCTDVLHTCRSESPDDTIRFAKALGSVLRAGDLLVLTGDLGAGKTQFTKGVALGLGIEDRVTSPTFALHQQYEGRELLHHLDVYRLYDLSETLDLDLPELLESGVTVIEWGDTIAGVLPTERLVVRIVADPGIDDARTLQFESVAGDIWRQRLAEAFS